MTYIANPLCSEDYEVLYHSCGSQVGKPSEQWAELLRLQALAMTGFASCVLAVQSCPNT